jgi:hypothetical protein
MNKPNGYIALLTTIIINSILMSVTISLALTSTLHSLNILNTQYKIESKNTALTCGSLAILYLAFDKSYSGNEEIYLQNGNICKIDNIPPPQNNLTTIYASSTAYNSTVKIFTQININNFSYSDWKEVQN